MKSTSIAMMGVLIAGSVGLFSFDNAFAVDLVDSEFTQFTTQETSYIYGETILISGSIDIFRLDQPARMHIDLPQGGTFLEFDAPVDDNGDFTFEIIAGGLGWTEEGTYTLFVTHDNYDFIESNTSFEYANFIQNENELEIISKQLDSQTQSKVKSLDVKISREQSQYDEYYKQYQYYEEKLSKVEDPKFSTMIYKLDSLNEKINSLIDERNMLVFLSDDVSVIVEDTEFNPIKQAEENPQKHLFCFLFWCW